MNLISPIKISYKNLMAAKFRSFLTMLGIIIGVSSVILIMAIGQSAQSLILDQVRGVGSNLIGVLPGASDEKGPPAAALGIQTTTFKYDDLEALRDGKNVPEVEDGSGYVQGTTTVSQNGNDLTMTFVGTTASYINVENSTVAAGRFFDRDEEKNMSKVVVLGANTVKNLFGQDDPLFKKVKIKDQEFMVIGVLEKKASASFGASSPDDSVFIPLRTAQKIVLGIDYLAYARLKVKSPELIPAAIAGTKITLRERHNITDPVNDDFSVRDQAAALSLISNITDVLRYFLLAIGSISLLVGGVGIMNIMLIAVNQRVREVGLRKAIGAKNNDITIQFLIESASISFLGGVIGIIFGVLAAFLVALILPKFGYNWPFIISIQSIVIATVISIAIGIVFGLYPARKASRVSPMEALRYE
jgi:putative ABC transport system permease protein